MAPFGNERRTWIVSIDRVIICTDRQLPSMGEDLFEEDMTSQQETTTKKDSYVKWIIYVIWMIQFTWGDIFYSFDDQGQDSQAHSIDELLEK